MLSSGVSKISFVGKCTLGENGININKREFIIKCLTPQGIFEISPNIKKPFKTIITNCGKNPFMVLSDKEEIYLDPGNFVFFSC